MRRLALAVLLLAVSAMPLGAQPDSLEAAKRRELADIERQARESREAAKQLKGRESKELVKLRRTDRELAHTRRRLRALQGRRHHLDQQLEVTQADLQRNVQQLGQRRARLARRLRSLYKTGVGRDLEFLLSTESFAQLLARWDYLVMVAESDRMLLEEVRERKEQVEADKQHLEQNLSAVKNNTRSTQSQNRRLSNLRRQRQNTVNTIKTQRTAFEEAAAELEKTARDLKRLLAELERRRREEEERAHRQGREPQPYHGDFAKGRGAIDWPVHGPLVGHFGRERHEKWGTETMNSGIDIQAPMGTPVHAVAKGRVDYTSEDYGTYGEMIILNHGDGYYTLYGHLSEIDVSVGQEVESGAVIGAVGDSGSLKGTVLHFEVRKGGSALNPQDWLR